MPRVDIWDVPEAAPEQPLWCGYRRDIGAAYEFEGKLGEGGFGSVRVVRQRSSGAEFACKSIAKRLDVPGLAPLKQQQHLENIQREVLILRKLRGTLNVVGLEAAYEDATHVHIVMEYCRGGELLHRMGTRHYSERTVASYMRAVLRTLAQCHAHRILHRDIKPGNFMLLTEAEDAPLKAIDFGLAVFFEPDKLPLTDLGLEGTPWYMAPEVLSSAVEPASDVWAAGVMAYQLLSGRFPFDDWSNQKAPALSLVWRSILSEQPSFSRGGWQDISEPAKDFCRALLNKDPRARPSARTALEHPWLRKGNTRQRAQGTQLTQVVQRLQRHNQQNLFRKTVLDMMANELLSRHMARVKEAEQAAAAAEAEAQHAAEPPAAAAAAAAASPGGAAAGTLGAPSSPAAAGQSATGSFQSPPPPLQVAAVDGGVTPPLLGPLGLRAKSLGPPLSPGGLSDPYQEGSVHRQQQLLRLIPPKRGASTLELQQGELPAAGQQKAARLSGEGRAGAAARLEGTWHGPSRASPGLGAAAAAGEGGSMHGPWGGSVKGAATALEALRRARERRSFAEHLGLLGQLPPGEPGAQQSQLPQQQQHEQGLAADAAAAAAAAAGESYHGPVRDAAAASLWDLQFMANRLAMEGSAHGNAYTQMLLRAAGSHSGRIPASQAMAQAAAVLAARQQAGSAGSTPAGSSRQSLEQPPQSQEQQQQQPLGHSPPGVHGDARLEGTWHGPARATGRSSVDQTSLLHAVVAERLAMLDRSWHGTTPLSDLRSSKSTSAKAATAAREKERAEFLQFLEAAKRARQEQRKVARLVLEGSTHSGGAWRRPGGGGAGSWAAPGSSAGGSSIMDDDDMNGSGAVSGSGTPSVGTPGSSGRGSSAAAATTAAAAADGKASDDGSKPGFLRSLRKSVKGLLGSGNGRSHKGADGAPRSRHSQGSAPNSSDGGGAGGMPRRTNSMDKLARDSWMPGSSDKGGSMVFELPPELLQQEEQQQAAAAAAPAPAVPAVADAAGAGEGAPAHVAEQILGMQSPGWQASMETRMRGEGAYAALMAATSMVTGPEPADASSKAEPSADAAPAPAAATAAPAAPPAAPAAPAAPPAAAAEDAAVPAARQASWTSGAGASLLVTPASSRQQQPQQQAAAAPAAQAPQPLRPKAAPKHVGFADEAPAVASQPPQQQQPQQLQQQQQSLLPQPGRPAAPAPAAAAAAAAPAAAPAAPAPAAPPCAKHVAFADKPHTVKHVRHMDTPGDALPAVQVVTPAGLAPAAAAATAAAEPAAPPPQPQQLLPGGALPCLEDVQQVLDALQYDQHDFLTVEQLQAGLSALGYRLLPSEVLELARGLGYGVEGVQGVGLSQFAASQLDWEELQASHRDEWLACLRATFEAMDADGDGRVRPADILEALKAKLPEAEVNAAIEDVLMEAAADEDEGLDFAAFKMLASVPSHDSLGSLEQYDARLEQGGSLRGGDAAAQALAPVPETGA